MNAQEFKIAFTKAMLEWYENGEVGPDPRGEWEVLHPDGGYQPGGHRIPLFDTAQEYRWKQPKKRIVVIDGVELVAPEVDAPEIARQCFVPAQPTGLYIFNWTGNPCEVIWLLEGLVFLTREDCQAMADAQRKQRMGGAL